MTLTQTAMTDAAFSVNGELYNGIKETIKESGTLKRFPVKLIDGMSYDYESETGTGEAVFRQIYEAYVGTGQESVFETEKMKMVTKEAVVDRSELIGTTGFDRFNSRFNSAVKAIRNTFTKGVLSGTGTNGQIKGLASRVLEEQKVTATANIVDDVEAILGKVVGDNVILLMNRTTTRKFSRAAKKEESPIQWIMPEGHAGSPVIFYGNAEVVEIEDAYLENDTIYALHLSEEDGVCILLPTGERDIYVQEYPPLFPGKGAIIEFIGGLACFNPKAIAAVVPEPAEPVIP